MRSWMIAAILGILWVSLWPALPPPGWQILAIGLALFALFLKQPSVAVFVLASLYAWRWGEHCLSHQLPPQLEGQELWVRGRICSLPVRNEMAQRFDFCFDEMRNADAVLVASNGKLQLSWYDTAVMVDANQAWSFLVKLKRLHGVLNAAGFDRETWLFQRGYMATGYLRQAQRLSDAEVHRYFAAELASLRSQELKRLQQAVQGLDHAGSIAALTLGLKDRLTHQQWQLLARTGTSHLLVISGMHVGLLATLLYVGARRFWLRLPALSSLPSASSIATACALSAAGVYSLLAGLAVPTQRALLMLALILLPKLLHWRLRSSTILLVALLIVLLLDPLAGLSAGFWLSFGAVVCIYLVSSARMSESARGSWSWLRKFGQGLRVQAGIFLLLTPTLLFWFGQLSWVSLLINVLAIPLISCWVVPWALLGLLLSHFDLAWAIFCSHLANQGLELFWQWITWGARQSWAAQSLGIPSWWLLPLTGLSALLLLPRSMPLRWLALLLPLLLWYPRGPSDTSTNLRLWDVGQGLSALVSNGEHGLLYDTGPRFSADLDAGAAIVVPNLQALNLRRLEDLIVSHGDADHAGGAVSVAAQYPPQLWLSGEPERAGQLGRADFCRAGQQWGWGQVQFEVLWPAEPRPQTANNRSCLLRIRVGPWRIMLTGDMDSKAEAQLIRRYGRDLQSDVLLLPHHGSKYSNSPAFLNLVHPRLALISAGYRNRFGHPAAETLARLRLRHVPYFNTADYGELRLQINDKQLEVFAERPQRWGYWHSRPQEAGFAPYAAIFILHAGAVAKPLELSTLSYRQ